MKGKFSYLSPEAARGEEVDRRADIFAVGILLYEMLTGKRLFFGETDYQTVELVRQRQDPAHQAAEPRRSSRSWRTSSARRWRSARKTASRRATDLQDALAQYSYSRGLKVISRDIAELVRQCLEDKRDAVGRGGKQAGSIIDHLLQDEIVKFTSVDFEDPGAAPLSTDDLALREPMSPGGDGDFIDPRGWAAERHTPAMGLAQIDALEARKTTKEMAVPGGGQVPSRRNTGSMPIPPPPPPMPAATSSPPPRRRSGSMPAAPPPGEPFESTPGPDRLAAVLEPTPAPQDFATGETSESLVIPGGAPRAGRSFLVGAVVGALILGAAFYAVRASKRAPESAPPPAQQTQTH